MAQQRVATTADSSSPTEARQRITQAAFRLFGERGYSCTSVADIADAADVQKSILYYYFGSKEALYQTLYAESAKNLRTHLLQALSDAGLPMPTSEGGWRVALPETVTCEALLSALIETLISLARDNRDPVRFFMAHIFAPDGDRPPVSTQEMEHITPHLIHHIGRAGFLRGELCGNIDDLERLLLGGLQYSIIRHLRSPAEEPLAAGLGQRIVSAVLRGFTPAKESRPVHRSKAPVRRGPASVEK